jgi:hypothetical protein
MDIFFISFKESVCEHNWSQLLLIHPEAKRIHGIHGIDRSHIACDQLSASEYFWTVDGDNLVTEKLIYNDPIVYDLLMFKSFDPLQENLTLLGGVKLWKKGSIINKTMSKGDFSLNATKNKIVIDKCYSTTLYNASPFDAWKTSFRHCVKLMSVIFQNRPNAKNIDLYLNQWRSCKDKTSLNSQWAYLGYVDAEQYVSKVDNNISQLNKINDYQWLEEYFGVKYGAP